MNESPFVSIILPTYNRAKLLPAAIESVLQQTYSDWELLIWNDGSQDNTEEIIKHYTDTRICTFSAENHGMSYALNQAMKHSKGRYVAFLDDDDTWPENKLSLQLKMLETFPEIDMVFGNYLNFNNETDKKLFGFDQTSHAMVVLNKKQLNSQEYIITGYFLKAVAIDNFIAFDSVLIRRNVLEELGEFNEGLLNAMDFEYWWRFGLAYKTAAYTETVALNRNKYPLSLSSNNLKTIQNQILALDSCAKLSGEKKQEETKKFLKPSYRNACQKRIKLFGLMGEKKKASIAFIESLKYGFQPGSLKLLISALITLKSEI